MVEAQTVNNSAPDTGRGKVVTWFADKGYGFIRPEAGGADCFLHVKELFPHQRRPRVGDRVTYRSIIAAPDKTSASCVRIAGFAWSGFALFCIALLPATATYAVCAWLGLLPLHPAAPLYMGTSLLTLAAYFLDKRRALLGGQRLSEGFLHHLELLGGWPGALLAQIGIRHKSSKRSYQITFWLIVLMHGAAWAAWYSGVRPSAVLQRLDRAFEAYETRRREKAATPSVLAELAHSSNRLSRSLSQRFAAKDVPAASPQAGGVGTVLAKLSGFLRAVSTPKSKPRDAERQWASDAPEEQPAEEPVSDPRVCRTRLIASAENRRIAGVVQGVSAAHGIRVALPAEFEGDGIIRPQTLINGFYRHFRVGEPLTVAIVGITMSPKGKTFDLLLVESAERLAHVQTVSSNRTSAVTTRLIPAPPRAR